MKAFLPLLLALAVFPARLIVAQETESPAKVISEAAAWIVSTGDNAPKPEDRPFLRFISLYADEDSPSLVKISDKETVELTPLEEHVQLIHWQVNQINLRNLPAVPREVTGRLLVVDLRDFGWDHAAWEVMGSVAYNFEPSWADVREWTTLASETTSRYPVISSQQFISLSSSPQHYYNLLFGGVARVQNETDLKSVLGYDPDFLEKNSQIVAVGVDESSVTLHNRRLEFYRGPFNTYKSFDTNSNRGESNVKNNPGHGTGHDLKIAGNEYIFRLSSGGYGAFLNDDKGNRVDVVPDNVARDGSGFARHSVVAPRNCWSCHEQGYKRPSDSIGELMKSWGSNLKTADRELLIHLQATYRASEFEAEIEQAQDRYDGFCFSLTREYGPAIAKKFRAAVVNYEDGRVGIERAAAEMGVSIEDATGAFLHASDGELRTLFAGRTIYRDAWESVFYQAMLSLQKDDRDPKVELPVLPRRLYVTRQKTGVTTTAIVLEADHDPLIQSFRSDQQSAIKVLAPALQERGNRKIRVYPIRFESGVYPTWIEVHGEAVGTLRYEVILR